MSALELLGHLVIALLLGVVFVAAGTVVVMAWPRRVQLATTTLSQSPWPVIAVGVLTGVLLPFVVAAVCGLLILTVIGILLVPIILLATLALWIYGAVTIGLWIGQRVAESGKLPVARQSLLVTAVVGLSLFAVITFLLGAIIPALGGFIAYMLGFVGVGAAILSRFGADASLGSVSRMLATGAGRVTHRLGHHSQDNSNSGDTTRRVS